MSSLTLIPRNWYSWQFDVSREGVPVAYIKLSCFRERGMIRIGESDYEVQRACLEDGFPGVRRDFVMRSAEGERVAQARKPSVWRRAMVFRSATENSDWTVRPASFCARRLLLLEGEEEAGFISPMGAFTRRAQAQLPDRIPLPAQMFAVWLATLIWKRDSDAGAVTAVAAAGS